LPVTNLTGGNQISYVRGRPMNFSEENRLKVLELLKHSLDAKQYETWIKDLAFDLTPEGELKIPLPSFYYVEWYRNNYLGLIEKAVAEVTGQELKISLVAPPEQGRLFAEEIFIKTRETAKETAKKAEQAKATNQDTGAKSPGNKYDFQLNEKYIFENYVVGPSNRMAHAAALAVAAEPGKSYNPLFVHGGVGLGKTHLLQTITHEIIKRFPNKTIYYRSCEEFVNDYIMAIKNNSLEKFRHNCRSKDVMIIDDIHFLGKGEKTASQEEFFHTFNALHNSQKQVILSSDSPPKDIPKIEDRLVSRFSWGMVARIDSPEYETRVAILNKKAEVFKILLPDDVVKYIGTAVNTNIRDLEGALIRLIGLARSSNQVPSLALAEEALKDIISFKTQNIKINSIIEIIAAHFSFTASDIQSKTRAKSVAIARQIGIYITRQLKPDLSLEDIGASFGGREHSTVLHSIEKIKKRVQKDAQFRDTIDFLKTEIIKKSV